MPTYRLIIAYDGTDFAGWQKQEPLDPELADPSQPRPAPIPARRLEPGLEAGQGRVALRTVQAVVERAVREVVREPVLVRGASRTDAGVHARAQVAVFTCSDGGREGETERRKDEGAEPDARGLGGWPLSRGVDRLLRAVNSRLPEDVQVMRAEAVREGFDPIGDCVAKGYSYTFWVGMHRALWNRRYVWHTWAELDLGAMQRAAGAFVGRHDFAGFAAAGHGRLSTVREVHECAVREVSPDCGAGFQPAHGGAEPARDGARADASPGRALRLDISGNGFLYNMVRIIAGTLHEVGRGRIDPDAIPEIIASKDRRRAGPTLPPEGLCLEWIRYRESSEPRA